MVVSKHQYDLDIIETYSKIESELATFEGEKLITGLDPKEYLERVYNLIKNYCQSNEIDFENHINNSPRLQLVIPSSSNNYPYFLGLTLAFYDYPRIKQFLEFQMKRYDGNNYYESGNFINLVEYEVYHTISNTSIAENNRRLEFVMQWVEKQRDKTDKPQTIDPKLSKVKNAFNKMPMDIVIGYFEQLSIEVNNAGSPYLSQKEVNYFIHKAFGQDPDYGDTLSLKIAPKGERQKICQFFWQFYYLSIDRDDDVQRKRINYEKLLADNFDNFTMKEVHDNFSKKPAKKIKNRFLSEN